MDLINIILIIGFIVGGICTVILSICASVLMKRYEGQIDARINQDFVLSKCLFIVNFNQEETSQIVDFSAYTEENRFVQITINSKDPGPCDGKTIKFIRDSVILYEVEGYWFWRFC